VKLPRCKCRRKAVTVAPGSAAVYAPVGIVIDRGKPAEAWCAACAAARGWLVTPPAAPTVEVRERKGRP